MEQTKETIEEIVKLKAELFDIIAEQDVLSIRYNVLQQEKIKKLNLLKDKK